MVVLPNGQVPPDGKYDMKFSLWNIVSGGSEGANEKWEETHSVDNGVNLVKGRFSVQLGGITPFPADLFIKNPNIWLQVQVDLNKNGFEDSEIFLPRVPFTSAPYAFQADNATTATNATHATDVLRIVRDFVVDSGESITAGDVVSFINGKVRKGANKIGYDSERVFNSANTWYISAAALSDTKFIVAYQDYANLFYGTAIVGTVSGSTITFGSEYVFNSATTWYTSVAGLSDSKFVVAYCDVGNSYYGTAIVGTVSGSTISYGSEYIFNSASNDSISAAALSDSKFVVAYRDWGNLSYGTAIVGTVSGSTITFGSEYVFNSADNDYISATALSDSKFVVAYRDVGNSKYGTAVVGTVTGSTITFGSGYVFNSADNNYISATALSDSKFVVAYRDMGNSNYGTAIVGTVSGSTITFGSGYVFNSASNDYISATALSDSKFVVAYRDEGNSNYGTAVVGTVTGSTITYGSGYVCNNADTYFISVVALSDTKFVVAYYDGGNSAYGTAIIGDFSEPFGLADGSASDGQYLPVILHGISDNHSGLTLGASYYGKPDGSLTRTRNAFRIGLAVSTTELLLELGR